MHVFANCIRILGASVHTLRRTKTQTKRMFGAHFFGTGLLDIVPLDVLVYQRPNWLSRTVS